MSGKQMEGDNERRRSLARLARNDGHRPSEEGVTLGGSKQPEHLRQPDREGPPPAGAHKMDAQTTRPPARPRTGRERPRRSEPTEPGRPDMGQAIRYRDLVAEVGHQLGLDFDRARTAAEATITAVLECLPADDRRRLTAALPAELYDEDNRPAEPPEGSTCDVSDLLEEVGRIARVPPEQARYRAQAVLSALAERDRGLVGSLALPLGTDELLTPPPTGGGLVGPDGRTPPLTEDELRAALAGLPDWSGSVRALSRTIVRPPGHLKRVLDRLDRLHPEIGRRPRIARPAEDTAVIVVRTQHVDAVTVLDINLAHRVNEVIDEAEESP